MTVSIFVIDAFTDHEFTGNPAAVCQMGRQEAHDSWLQAVAREMRHSETAFVWKTENDFRLRWFTPAVEVDLCGHATLAAAHALWEAGELSHNEEARFRTRSGKLTARREGTWILLDFPDEPVEPAASPAELLRGIGVPLRFVGRNRMDYLVEVESEDVVRDLKPDLRQLGKLEARGIIVTAAGSGGYDFVSRFFAPRVGVDEDPVCGSAHCALAPYWGQRLAKKSMTARQVSERGGVISIDVGQNRIVLGGHAKTILTGTLLPNVVPM